MLVVNGTRANDAACKIEFIAVDVISNEWYNRDTKRRHTGKRFALVDG